MSAITIRLWKELDRQLTELAEKRSKTRSEIARVALENLVNETKHAEFQQRLAAEARVLASNDEGLGTAEEFLPLQNEALALAETAIKVKKQLASKTRK